MSEIKTPTMLFAEEIYERYLSCKATGLYAISKRGYTPHFSEILKDAIWAYGHNAFLVERFFFLDKCETVSLTRERMSEAETQVRKAYYESVAGEENPDKLLELFTKFREDVSKFMPEEYEDTTLSYTNNLNKPTGYPVIPLTELSDEVLKDLSYQLAYHATSHFSATFFLKEDTFYLHTEPVAYEEEYADVIAILNWR